MVNVLGLGDVPVPTFGIGTGKITILFSIFLIVIAGGIVIWLVYQYRTYNKKIVVFENIAGQGWRVSFKDKGRLLKLGDGGEELMYLRKKRLHRTAYGRKMGKNEYWFAIGQDGYWYNFILGDLDAKMGMLDIEPIDRDMRYMHVAIRKNIQDRFRKQNFMEKYGMIVVSGVFLIIILIGMWFLLDKMADMTGSLAGAVEEAKKTQEVTRQLVGALDKIAMGGSGISTG